MRGFAVLLAIATVLLQYRLWISDDGLQEWQRLGTSVETQRSENLALKERNKLLAAEVADLKQGMDALEERARSELGMVARNESFFQIVPPSVQSPAGGAESPTRTAQR